MGAKATPGSANIWTGARIGKVSTWVTILLAFYFGELAVGPDEYWWSWAAAGIAFIFASVSVYLIFRGVGFANFIDFLTIPSEERKRRKKGL